MPEGSPGEVRGHLLWQQYGDSCGKALAEYRDWLANLRWLEPTWNFRLRKWRPVNWKG